ncbi:uncharacterized protein LOC115476900 [Microcaecilia unicolor]|uniref:Uncharacterized protein LOC115476900 n=1 Tax=Microcaecilia unicolor TaxID=1415580 RepID=A0A6P7Z0Q5_9AMPH|nr:uncharacterized protein LOC115476900 [Microcaecilia unicolor]
MVEACLFVSPPVLKNANGAAVPIPDDPVPPLPPHSKSKAQLTVTQNLINSILSLYKTETSTAPLSIDKTVFAQLFPDLKTRVADELIAIVSSSGVPVMKIENKMEEYFNMTLGIATKNSRSPFLVLDAIASLNAEAKIQNLRLCNDLQSLSESNLKLVYSDSSVYCNCKHVSRLIPYVINILNEYISENIAEGLCDIPMPLISRFPLILDDISCSSKRDYTYCTSQVY